MSFSWYVLRKRLGSNGAVMLSTSCFAMDSSSSATSGCWSVLGMSLTSL